MAYEEFVKALYERVKSGELQIADIPEPYRTAVQAIIDAEALQGGQT